MALFDDTRSAWSARGSTLSAAQYRSNTVAPSRRVGVSYHYPGSSTWPITPASAHSACLRRVSDWQRQHQSKGWNDLGYNVVICQHARSIEGRAIDQQGSHSPGVNVEHYGVNLMVANTQKPTDAMFARAARVHADLTARSGRSLRAWGHRDDPKAATACPGSHILAWVRAGGPFKTGDKGVIAPPPPPKEEEDDMAYTQDELRTLAGQGVLRTQIGRATINAKGDPLTVGIALERLYNGSSAQSAQIVALTSMVTVLSGVVADGKHGLSPAQVEKILQDGMREGLKGFSVTLVADERP